MGDRDLVCGRSAPLDLLVLSSWRKAWSSGEAGPSGGGILAPAEEVGAESLETSQTPSELPGCLLLCLGWLPAALTHLCTPWRWCLHHDGSLAIFVHAMATLRDGVEVPYHSRCLGEAGYRLSPGPGCGFAWDHMFPAFPKHRDWTQRPEMALGIGVGEGHSSCISPRASVGWGL